jgi:hypothetical protein
VLGQLVGYSGDEALLNVAPEVFSVLALPAPVDGGAAQALVEAAQEAAHDKAAAAKASVADKASSEK